MTKNSGLQEAKTTERNNSNMASHVRRLQPRQQFGDFPVWCLLALSRFIYVYIDR